MDSLLAITSAAIQDGFMTILLGILVVFLGMSIIVFFVWLFGVLFNKFVNIKVSKPKVEQKTQVEDITTDGTIPEDIKVAIIAAVTACYYGQENKKCDFKVRKFKR